MKTTLDLPDDLMRRIKVKAAHEDRTLKELVAELLETGLEQPTGPVRTATHRVRLPLIRGGHPASPDEEMTPERVAALLTEMDVQNHADR